MTLRFNISLFLTLGLTLLFLSYCTSLEDNNNNYPPTDEQRLTYALDHLMDSIVINKKALKYATHFYKERNFKTLWVKDSVFKELEFANYINEDVMLNLPLKTIESSPYSNSNTPYQKEVLTLLRLSEFLDIESKGLINFKDSILNDHGFADPAYLDKFLNSKSTNNDWISHLLSFRNKNINIRILHRSLNNFTNQFPLNDKVISVEQKDSLGSESNKVALNLKEKGFINNVNISRDSLIVIFKNFQYMNGLKPDGILGKNSLRALHQPNLVRYYKGIIALEKLKAIPDSLISSKYIEVNIPSFLLHFYNEDTIVSRHRVVAGANLTQTPEFEAPIKFIVTHPFWHVPYSIASTEILYGARKDTNYFIKRNYILTKKGETISPDSIDWKNITSKTFPFRVKQSSGRSNSLGLLKFLFPNKHAVYIHDTPAKHLFARDERNFSHGCIRVEDPFELAKQILYLEEHAYKDSLDTLANREKETYLNINDRFLVHIRYRTAVIDDSTLKVRFHNDIYGREEKYMKLFEVNLP
jgi:murein L,D-transpeptidase YcbB/YkuD